MGAPAVPQLSSFHHVLEQKSKEKLLLLSSLKDLEWGYPHNEFDDDFEDDGSCSFRCRRRLRRAVKWTGSLWTKARDFMVKGWDFGLSDPRRVIFAAKFGLAISLMSVLICLKEPFDDIYVHSLWAIFTVLFIFEFSVGSTLSKGFNRAIGTISAGGLALGVAYLCTLTGKLEEMFIILSIFVAGSVATFIKLYPTMKPYDYGFRVFMLTFCIIMVSGNRTRQFVETTMSRFLLIGIGAAVALGVNICIYPIWAGEDLHKLVVKNFMCVAKSLEGCVNGYLECVEYERIPSKILAYRASDDPLYSGYRSSVESTAQEDNLLSFAVWEPPHGPYKMLRYPWKNYIKVSGALRYCAFTVMALHGCILSEIQAPPERRQVFRSELQRVGVEGAKVLREIGDKVKTMRKLSTTDILYEVHEAAEELQKKIDRQSHLLVNSERWQIGGQRRQPEEVNDTLNGLNNTIGSEGLCLGFKSRSEAVLDLRSVQLFSKSWDVHNHRKTVDSSFQQQHQGATIGSSSEVDMLLKQQISWPVRQSFNLDDMVINEGEHKTYESASALSLATFASLLIEFVARLQNIVNAFEELAEAANFKDCVDEPAAEAPGFCKKFFNNIFGKK